MFDRRLVQCFDWGLLAITVLIAVFGLVTLYSASASGSQSILKTLYAKQLIWYGIGVAVMVCCFVFNYKLLDPWANVIYLACVGLLVAVLLFGKYVAGSRRWLMLGPISVQPSELIKIAIIIVLARYYSKEVNTTGFTLRELVIPLLLAAVPFLLIVRQPDLGTGLMLILIVGSMTLFIKIEKRSLMYLAGTGLVFVPMVWFFLKGYQKQRILTFLNPDRDPLGAGYHIIQSKIAIGSGMIFGKGFLEGTQNVLSFLPEQHTDFIFSVLAEEWGLFGTVSLLFLFFLLLAKGLSIAYKCRNPFGSILAVGITVMIFWQVLINTGMVMGLMPVVGIPLPFVSYGGSSIITMMIGIGILMNISMRRFVMD
ncbi:MAG: rod shape-determining protein RodA [Desulfobacterales bacterium]|nr:rod shape-determining protein RodA [Desulfobacterales bacterium]MDD4072854.1 rod shape-determining protein RodA [Desulfobacterales bacterium]MDD4393945.1 rod shape-determining protein RodA [Desulfobacterales bacterium]